MADVKISGLPAAASASGTDQHEVNQGGVSKRLTNAQILAYIEGAIGEVKSLIFNGGVAEIDENGGATFANGSTLLNDNGSASFAQGALLISNVGDVVAASLTITGGVAQIAIDGAITGSTLEIAGAATISAIGEITTSENISGANVAATTTVNAGVGFFANSLEGLTQDVVIGGVTLHFEGGILTSVT